MDYAKESLRLHGEWKGNIGPKPACLLWKENVHYSRLLVM